MQQSSSKRDRIAEYKELIARITPKSKPAQGCLARLLGGRHHGCHFLWLSGGCAVPSKAQDLKSCKQKFDGVTMRALPSNSRWGGSPTPDPGSGGCCATSITSSFPQLPG